MSPRHPPQRHTRLDRRVAKLEAGLEAASLAIRDLSKALADRGVVPYEGWRAFRAAREALRGRFA